jgi:fermentation-respiration switch protein FrsA (DUF1100 family)
MIGDGTVKFDSLAKIKNVHRPVFVTHRDGDGLVPFEMGKRLFGAANEPKEFVAMHGDGHSDTAPPAEVIREFDAFLKKYAP